MSRATATPPASAPGAGTPAPRPARTPATATAATPATAPAAPRPRGPVRSALEGTPGRMRLLSVVAALVAAAFGLVGAMSLWSSAGALSRADHNTDQVVRIQTIYADLVRADSDATSSFLVGGIENPDQRADYDASIARVATGIADAAQAQPADGQALGTLNTTVQTYAATVEQARVYNRQGLPVGATYLSDASATLRSDVLPVVTSLVNANKQRADAEFDASGRPVVLIVSGLVALAVLVLVMVWLARRTHRYVNAPVLVGSLIVLVSLALGIVTVAGVGNTVTKVRQGDFANTVKLADARAAAYDAKSNESLTLIQRGSGSAYEKSWQTSSNNVLSAFANVDSVTQRGLESDWDAYVTAHQAIRAADDGGNWDAAVQLALKTDPGSANATFTTFTSELNTDLANAQASTSASLTGPVGWVTALGWLLLALCVVAALLILRGIGQRIEEYR